MITRAAQRIIWYGLIQKWVDLADSLQGNVAKLLEGKPVRLAKTVTPANGSQGMSMASLRWINSFYGENGLSATYLMNWQPIG